MPWRPRPGCRYPRCPNLAVDSRNGYCPEHQAEAQRRQHRGRFRTPSRQRGYDRRYELNRAALLARRPLCELCKAEGRVQLAEQVHHRRPLAQGGTNDLANLMPVCREHHEALHRAPVFSGGPASEPAGGAALGRAGFPESELSAAGVSRDAQ